MRCVRGLGSFCSLLDVETSSSMKKFHHNYGLQRAGPTPKAWETTAGVFEVHISGLILDLHFRPFSVANNRIDKLQRKGIYFGHGSGPRSRGKILCKPSCQQCPETAQVIRSQKIVLISLAKLSFIVVSLWPINLLMTTNLLKLLHGHLIERLSCNVNFRGDKSYSNYSKLLKLWG